MRVMTAFGGLAIGLVAVAAGQEGDGASPQELYEVTTALDMPHLEENLRYSITHEERCLTPQALRQLFPILSPPRARRLPPRSRID